MKIMKPVLRSMYLASLILLLVFLAACGSEDTTSAADQEGSANDAEETSANEDKLQVVSSFTIITDMVREVGGDKVDVHNLVPTGTDPHEYEPLPEDTKKAADADVLFYNGMNLEGRRRWLVFQND